MVHIVGGGRDPSGRIADSGSMISSTIERNASSYRQGLVLGFTMAEALLLLVFCLLIATGASLSHERGRSDAAERRAAEDRLALAELSRTDRVAELLAKRGEATSAAAVDDLWK